ncbi:hypothetical protein NDN08_003201 [Rhodosorus marinus]|uniref:Uncharacterized protein n=1 Tax=Rhodosorus marinus TaxID=101924 RepID=A0AAV8V045_9RHOD|nr:hypothetical protein NDN08_003201 [Rhodosorus marinus]
MMSSRLGLSRIRSSGIWRRWCCSGDKGSKGSLPSRVPQLAETVHEAETPAPKRSLPKVPHLATAVNGAERTPIFVYNTEWLEDRIKETVQENFSPQVRHTLKSSDLEYSDIEGAEEYLWMGKSVMNAPGEKFYLNIERVNQNFDEYKGDEDDPN